MGGSVCDIMLNRQGSTERKASITLVANSPVNIEIIYICTPPPERLNEETGLAQPALMRGLVRLPRLYEGGNKINIYVNSVWEEQR